MSCKLCELKDDTIALLKEQLAGQAKLLSEQIETIREIATQPIVSGSDPRIDPPHVPLESVGLEFEPKFSDEFVEPKDDDEPPVEGAVLHSQMAEAFSNVHGDDYVQHLGLPPPMTDEDGEPVPIVDEAEAPDA